MMGCKSGIVEKGPGAGGNNAEGIRRYTMKLCYPGFTATRWTTSQVYWDSHKCKAFGCWHGAAFSLNATVRTHDAAARMLAVTVARKRKGPVGQSHC